jgi:hypothetical protein
MHRNAMKCNKTHNKWCINKHGASKNLDTFETYQEASFYDLFSPPSREEKIYIYDTIPPIYDD